MLDADGVELRLIWREATTMTLYVSIVLLATLAALPSGHDDAGDPIHGPVGAELIVIVWGTTIGLALAHAFAFRVATKGLGGGRLHRQDFMEVSAEVVGAAFVAVLASLPVLLFSPETEQKVVPFVLALIIGSVGYLVERANGRTRMSSLLFAAVTLVAGLTVAAAKNILAGH